MKRLLILIPVVAIAAVALPAQGATSGVAVKDNFFKPKVKTIDKGDTVKFSWATADNPHDVKFTRVPAGARKPRRCSIRSSGSCKRTFRKRGTYKYVCTVHVLSDNMRGRIVVD